MSAVQLVVLIVVAAAVAPRSPAGRQEQALPPSEPALPTYTCLRTNAAISVDGRLEASVWSRVPAFRDFRRADDGTPARHRTTFRACWDDRYLYLAFVCNDPEIIATMTARDSPLYEEDCVEAFVSTGGDLKRYWEFEFSPRNTQMDASVFPNEQGTDKIVDYSWNCEGLLTATEVLDSLDHWQDRRRQWAIEIALPFAQIARDGRAPAAGETWRANFYRIEYAGEPEFACFSPTLAKPPSFHVPARFGRLVFSSRVAGE